MTHRSPTPEPAADRALRVLTLNVYAPENPDWERRLPLIAKTVRELDPDVVALQEVPVASSEVLELVVGAGRAFTHFSQVSESGVGGTLATRWPARFVTEVDLRLTERARRVLPWTATVIVEVDTPVGRVVLAHHKPSWPFPFERERLEQAVLAAQALEDHIGKRDLHAVVLGDFDATPDAASMRFWRGRQPVDGLSVCYQDAWEYANPGEPGYTFDLANPLVRDGEVSTAVSRRIDYVLVRAGLHGPTLQVADCRRVLDRPVDGVWASDHSGVLADLVLPERPPGFRS